MARHTHVDHHGSSRCQTQPRCTGGTRIGYGVGLAVVVDKPRNSVPRVSGFASAGILLNPIALGGQVISGLYLTKWKWSSVRPWTSQTSDKGAGIGKRDISHLRWTNYSRMWQEPIIVWGPSTRSAITTSTCVVAIQANGAHSCHSNGAAVVQGLGCLCGTIEASRPRPT